MRDVSSNILDTDIFATRISAFVYSVLLIIQQAVFHNPPVLVKAELSSTSISDGLITGLTNIKSEILDADCDFLIFGRAEPASLSHPFHPKFWMK